MKKLILFTFLLFPAVGFSQLLTHETSVKFKEREFNSEWVYLTKIPPSVIPYIIVHNDDTKETQFYIKIQDGTYRLAGVQKYHEKTFMWRKEYLPKN